MWRAWLGWTYSVADGDHRLAISTICAHYRWRTKVSHNRSSFARRRLLRLPCRAVGWMWGGVSGWYEPLSMAASIAVRSAREVDANSLVIASWVRDHVS